MRDRFHLQAGTLDRQAADLDEGAGGPRRAEQLLAYRVDPGRSSTSSR